MQAGDQKGTEIFQIYCIDKRVYALYTRLNILAFQMLEGKFIIPNLMWSQSKLRLLLANLKEFVITAP